jgi:hypothetical protein
MTLKEKFLPKMYCFMGSGMLSNTYDENVAEGNATECEKIAEDFTFELLDFIEGTYSYSNIFDYWYLHADTSKTFTKKELIETYKKEKEL